MSVVSEVGKIAPREKLSVSNVIEAKVPCEVEVCILVWATEVMRNSRYFWSCWV